MQAPFIHELFELQTTKTPDALAAAHNNQQLSYAQLNAKANRLARHLRKLGVEPNARVAISAERSLDMLIGILSILKAGGAYVPLDPTYPKDRLQFMLEDSAPTVLLVDAETRDIFAGVADGIPRLNLAADNKFFTGRPEDDLDIETAAVSAAPGYIIYTSGSTGQPKGIAMPQEALVNLISWQITHTRAIPGARTLQYTPISFDVSFQEIFSTWCQGGALVLIDETTRRDPQTLLEYLEQQQIERLFLPPTALEQLAQFAVTCENAQLKLREIITAGEPLRLTSAIKAFFSKLDQCRLVNQYGPAETHVVTAFAIDDVCKSTETLPPIGRPIDNAYIYILNEALQPVPDGDEGEIYIGGIQAGGSYFNRRELTAERFLKNPFIPSSKAQMYKTGDLGRRRADESLEFLGRKDFQVKIRGYRIELGEIEANLADHPKLRDVAVTAREDDEGDRRLVAYYTSDENVTAAELRAYLTAILPGYMVPAAYMQIAALPLTPSGKLDRNALPAPKGNVYATPAFEAPQDETEQALAGIWAELLHLEKVGRHDNFFDLGGHSLLALSMLSKASHIFQCRLSLDSLFIAPTVAALARSMQGKECRLRQFSLYPVRRSKFRPALFWVEYFSDGNEVIDYLRIDNAIYGLRYGIGASPDAKLTLPPSIEKLAAHYLEEIFLVQPNGPYFLTGHSLGGMIAYEMAQQLTARGESIAMLVLVDTPLPDTEQTQDPFKNRLADLMRLSPARLAKKLFLRAETVYRSIKRIFIAPKYSPHRYDPELVDPLWNNYHPQNYSGRVTLIKASENKHSSYYAEPPAHGWKKLSEGGLDIYEVRGDHDSILAQPACIQVADILTRIMRCAD